MKKQIDVFKTISRNESLLIKGGKKNKNKNKNKDAVEEMVNTATYTCPPPEPIED